MPITQDGNGKIVYTKPEKGRQFEETGTVLDNDFAIADKDNVLKQVQFEIIPASATKGTLTLQASIAGDTTVTLTSLSSTAFSTIQPDSGTSPTADSAADTLTITSSDLSISVAGDSSTDTIDLKAIPVEDIRGFIEVPYDRTYTLDQYAKYGYTIEDITVTTASGTCTLALQINGASVTSISAVSVTSTPTTATATGAKTVAAGDKVTMVITSSSAPDSLAFSIKIKRT